MNATIQIFYQGRWCSAGHFTPHERTRARAMTGAATLESDIPSPVAHLEGPTARVPLSHPATV